MTWHGYFAAENLNLNASQRQTLIDELRLLGPSSDPSPARLNHWRTRLDNQAVIFEAAFSEVNLTINKFKQRLAIIFSVQEVDISHSVQQITYDALQTPVVTFSHLATNYIRFAAFGGVGATWEQSGDECRAFLAANKLAWESEI